MSQNKTLVAAFGGTLAVLLGGAVVLQALAGGQADPSASPSPTPPPIATARPTGTPGPSASLTATPSPTPTPSATPTPAGTPQPTAQPGATYTVVVLGYQYVKKDVPPNGSVTNQAGGAILLRTDRTFSEPLTVTYKLPYGQLPPGTIIANLDAAICGLGAGDFWETYGPAGADPFEYEFEAPGPDGCWHYVGGNGADTTVLAIVSLQSTFRVDRVVYTATAQ